jgi:hypothetical protein
MHVLGQLISFRGRPSHLSDGIKGDPNKLDAVVGVVALGVLTLSSRQVGQRGLRTGLIEALPPIVENNRKRESKENLQSGIISNAPARVSAAPASAERASITARGEATSQVALLTADIAPEIITAIKEDALKAGLAASLASYQVDKRMIPAG